MSPIVAGALGVVVIGLAGIVSFRWVGVFTAEGLAAPEATASVAELDVDGDGPMAWLAVTLGRADSSPYPRDGVGHQGGQPRSARSPPGGLGRR